MQRLRLGVIGTGSVVREIYQHLYFNSRWSPMLSIEAAADPNEAVLNDFCDRHDIPRDRRFADYRTMLERIELDAVHCNTPDSLHEEPTVAALERGLDVLLPKPLADRIGAAHRMIDTARRTGRLLAVDFHKRDDPRLREAAARYRAGRYGKFQLALWQMTDRLMVADPNHEPSFFATPDFAARNTPISFLTVHMADSLMVIIDEKPITVRAHGWKQKLASLEPIAVDGFDMCDTEVRFEHGGVAHIVTGWHLPNPAHAITVETTRTICTDGMFDLMHTSGYRELTHSGNEEAGVLFLGRERDGLMGGFGLAQPASQLEQILRHRQGRMPDDERARLLDPKEVGFWATAIIEAAHQSLAQGTPAGEGVTHGKEIDLPTLLRSELCAAAAHYLAP